MTIVSLRTLRALHQQQHCLVVNKSCSVDSEKPAASKTPSPESSAADDTITAKPTASASGTDAAASDTAEGTEGASGSATGTAEASETADASATASESAAATTFDERLPAGGIRMITPAPISGSQYYKIGDYVTFKWNYTSVSRFPSKVDVLVSCSKNQGTYTIAANQSAEKTGDVTWDTRKFQTGEAPLLEATYTLIVHDAAEAITAQPRAGFLGMSNQFTFGMYEKSDYVDKEHWKCSSCLKSDAAANIERRALMGVMTMAVVTAMTFTWFVVGVGVV
ncbi:MAG: hypothetical protein M1833_005566 [Piccolia ochrophora]|nr:MAG: hypothetical protein M1833_005566 [Piccolia ochrophora]